MIGERSEQLTEVQRRCLRLVAKGHTSKEIALKTGLSPHTVSKYVEQATSLLGATNRRQAAQFLTEMEASPQYERFEYEPATIAETPDSGILGASPDEPDDAAEERRSGLDRLIWLPPLGGSEHNLTASETLAAIMRVAIFVAVGSAGLIALGYWLMRLFA